MKKLLMIIIWLVLLFVPSSYAVEWRPLNQTTIAWNATVLLSDGSTPPAGHSFTYRVYQANEVKDSIVPLGDTDQLTYTITFEQEGKYIVGVSTVRLNENRVEISESDINWSDVNGASTEIPFGFINFISPAMPAGLRQAQQ